MLLYRTIVKYVLTASLIAPLICVIGNAAFQRIIFEFNSPSGSDSAVYWAMGRGIVNGLTPYADLFDNKPPGIHLVTALSLLLTGGFDFAQILQAACLSIIGLTPALALVQLVKRNSISPFNYALASLAGFLCLVYAGMRCDELQTEFFGAAIGALYIVALTLEAKSRKIARLVLLSVLIATSAGFKEPFIIVLAACALIMRPTIRGFWQDFLLPSLGAIVLAIAYLTLMNWFNNYLTIYLDVIFNFRLRLSEIHVPLWKRGSNILKTMRDLALFNIAFTALLVLCTAIYCLGPLIRRADQEHDYIKDASKENLFWTTARRMCAALAAWYLASFAIELGGFGFGHYYIFGVPLYLTLIITGYQAISHTSLLTQRLAGLLGFLLLAWGAYNLQVPDYDQMAETMSRWRIPGTKTAEHIDHVLDDCGIARYLSIGFVGAQPYAFTKHSPLGPLFVQWPPWISYPLFRNSLMGHIHSAEVISVNTSEWWVLGDLASSVQKIIHEQYQDHPWNCFSGNTTAVPPFKIFYRRTGEK